MLQTEKDKRLAILFICLGNICRSTAAQAVMQKMVDEAGLLFSSLFGGQKVNCLEISK